MTTDAFALVVTGIGLLIVLVGAGGLYWRDRRRLKRLTVPPEWTEPISIADWRQRAYESQRRSDERRAK